MCAGQPDAPNTPISDLANRDVISVSWSAPNYDGGSPVLGYLLYMRNIESAQFTLVWNGSEDPTMFGFTTYLDELGNKIRPGTYEI